MAKTFDELYQNSQFKAEPVSADVAATIAPNELTTAGILSIEQEPSGGERAWDTMKAAAVEIGTPLATGIGASPLLAGGPLGWGLYAAIQLGSGIGSNAVAQKMRNPEEDWSPEEGIAAGLFSAIPGIQAAKVAKLGKLGTVSVRAGEGAAMAGGESVTRQTLEMVSDERENLDAFEIGFATLAGAGVGGALGRVEATSGFNRLGVSTSDAKKIQKRVEANVAERINTIDKVVKNPELKGDVRDALLKERDELKEQIEIISKTDAEYVARLRKKAKEEQTNAERVLVDMLNEAGQGRVVTNVAEEAVDKGVKLQPAPAPSKPTKMTKKQKLQAIERMGMSDEDLTSFLEGKTEILPLNIARFSSEDDIQKSFAGVLEQLGDRIKSKRGKLDRDTLIKTAARLRSKLDPSVDPLKYAEEVAGEADELIFKSAVADSMTFHAFNSWSKKMDTNPDFNDPKVVNDMLADLDRLGGFAEASSKIGTSAGRLLQSRKVFRDQIAAAVSDMERKATKVEKGLTAELIKYSKDLKPSELKEQIEKLGGLKSLRGFLNELRVVRDPKKLGQLLATARKGRIARMADAAMELRYDAMLSGPQTQAAAAFGNALMSAYSLANQAVGGLATGNLQATKMALRTAKNLLFVQKDAFKAALTAAKNSQGQMSLNTHYEKVGGKALAMEATGLKGAVGETIENVGELISFGPKGLVFQDEYYRHMFAKAQVRSLLTEEYNQMLRKGEVAQGTLDQFIEGRMSRYFVDGKRYKTRQDVELEGVRSAQELDLDGDEAKEHIQRYIKDNWTEKLSSELEYLRDFGDRVTFQQELSKDYGTFEKLGSYLQDIRDDSYMVQYAVPFIKTPVNIFKEAGGAMSIMGDIPGVRKLWARTEAELNSENPLIRAQAQGRKLVGGALWMSAIYLADQKLITSSGPQNYRELENKRNTGWQPNALNVSGFKRYWETGESGGDKPGDKYVSLTRFDPIATLTGLASDLLRAKEDNDFPEEQFSYWINTVAFALTEAVGQKSYLETVGSALEALTSGRATSEDAALGEAFLEELVRGNTPSILNSLGRSDDPYVREVNGMLEMLKNRLPGFIQTLDPKRNQLGQKVKTSYNRLTTELNTLLPTKLSQATNDKALQIIAEVRGAYAFPAADRVIKGLDLRDFKVEGTNQTFYDRWKELYSELPVAEEVIEVYENPDIAKMTRVPRGSPLTDYRKQAVSDVLAGFREEALGLLLEEYPELEEQYEYMGELQLQQVEGEEIPSDTLAPSLQPLLQQ